MSEPARCASCGSSIPERALACPICQSLIHSARLKELVASASAAAEAGDHAQARSLYGEALALLPPGTRQHEALTGRLAALPAAEAPQQEAPSWAKRLGPLGAAGLLVWKFKTLALMALGHGKTLLLGLTKGTTFFSMLASLGVYWAIYGWRFAAGMIGSIYIHEMGHVAALRDRGIPATAPMFIPGFGAVVRLQSGALSPVDNARVGLAGPLWGLGASAAAWLAGHAFSSGLMVAIAHWGAQINLFNLLPIWQLDGARGLASLSRGQRLVLLLALGTTWMFSEQGILALITLLVAGRALFEQAPDEGDRPGLLRFVFLVATLAAIARATTRAH